MDDTLTIITGLSDRQRKQALSWWANLPEEKNIEILQCGVQLYYQLKQSHGELTGRINRYCALILSVRQNGWDTITNRGYRVAEESQLEDFSNLRTAKVAELVRKGRTPILRRKLFAFWGEVAEMKKKGYGFRPIAEYLLRTRKISVSAVYLSRLWKEVSNDTV
jgi:hypothetical protein